MKKIISLTLFCMILMCVGCASTKKLEYAHGLHFVIAVDNTDVEDIDHVEAGTYVFDVTNKNLGEAPLYDI